MAGDDKDDGAWLFDVVHALASAYGWDKKTVLEQIYPDEIEPYIKRIRKDEANKNLNLLALIQNPHTKNPQKLVKDLQNKIKGFENKYYNKDKMSQEDVNKLMEIKRQMQANAQKRKF